MWKNIKDPVLKSNRNVIKTVIFNNVEYKTIAENNIVTKMEMVFLK